jgi:hypothetical protein
MTSSCGPIRLLHSNFTILKRFALQRALPCVLLIPCVAIQGFGQQAIMDALPDAPSSAQASFPPASTEAEVPQGGQNPPPEPAQVTVPAGTRLTLVLSNAVNSRETKNSDQISAQLTAPVIVNDQVAIPAGTYVQGKPERLTRTGSQAEMVLQSASLVFADGYIARLSGPVNIESAEWTAANNPSGGSKAAIILVPMISLPLGALIGHAADGKNTSTFAGMTITTPSHTGLVSGTIVGFVAGLGTSFGLMAHSRGFYVDAGAPMSMTLAQPLTLTQAQVDDAVQKAATQPAPAIVAPKRPAPPDVQTSTDHGTCYTPGSPGTPDIVIPGTPPIGDSPGTPPTVIPGIPATPPTPYPCP